MPAAHHVALALGTLSALALAQGVQPLTGTYRFAHLGCYFQGPCTTTGPGFSGETGTMQFAPAGTFALVGNQYDVCAGGAVLTGPDSVNGSYAVATSGTLVLDFDPQNPGTDTAPVFLRSDASVGVHTPDQAADETSFAVLVALSSGRGNGDLQGPYHVVRQALTGGVGVAAATDLGILDFNGSGGFTDVGSRRAVTTAGGTSSAAYSTAGSYVVANDGTLTVGTGLGAVSADGEFLFYLTTSGTTVSLTVAVRAGTGITAATAAGSWGLARTGVDHAAQTFDTDFADTVLSATGALSGAVNGTTVFVDVTPAGGTAMTQVATGTYAVANDGTMSLLVAGGTTPARLSANGTFLVAREFATGESGLLVGVRRCPWPQQYGTATAGSGAIAPGIDGTGGFPYPGNATFAVAVVDGRGGAFALVAFAFGASPGLPLLGGTLWLDPTRVLATVGLPLSGPSGVPGAGAGALPFALPPNPGLAGVQFYVQAGVLDPGAPQGVAFTPGLDLRLCR